jgi:glycosyltransferase involved in cell wall biosynthesis
MPPDCPEVISHPKLTIQRLKDPLMLIQSKLPSNRFGRVVFASLRGVLWPDISVLWMLRVARSVDTSAYDRVLVYIMPPSLLVLGWLKQADSRWIFDFQESVSPSQVGPRRSPVYRWLLPLFTCLQRAVLKKTAHVIFATKSYIRDYVQFGLLEEEKAVHVPLFYDDAVFKEVDPPVDRFVIECTGLIGGLKAGGRSPETFLNAFSLFLSRNPQARATTVFKFHGPWMEEHTEMVRSFGVQDVVQINPSVPYNRYIELLSEASVLLLVTGRADNIYVPSKMMDYFGAKRPILGFVPPDCETYSILKEAGMAQYVSDETDIEGGVRSLEQLWQAWKDGRPACTFAGAEQWSASFQVPRVVQLLMT